MTYALIGRLVSTKTLLRIAFTALSLHPMGTAFAQGVPAGTTAPTYGTNWAAPRAQADRLNTQNVASESAKTAPAEAPKAAENKRHLFSHRPGG